MAEANAYVEVGIPRTMKPIRLRDDRDDPKYQAAKVSLAVNDVVYKRGLDWPSQAFLRNIQASWRLRLSHRSGLQDIDPDERQHVGFVYPMDVVWDHDRICQSPLFVPAPSLLFAPVAVMS